MEEIVAALGAQQVELTRLVIDLGEADWVRPSRCDGWSVADVVLHLAQTNELAIGSATGYFAEVLDRLTAGAGPARSIDDGADLMVRRERGPAGDIVCERWQRSADGLRAALGACDPHVRVTWVAGELSALTLATTRLAETWIHTGDVAAALGTIVVPSDRLRPIARLAWRTLPYTFAREGKELGGPVAFLLEGPGGEAWHFIPESEATTTITGPASDLCLVAARRAQPEDTALVGRGPDAESVLTLVRTYA